MARLRPDFASGKLSDASLTSTVTVFNSPQFATLPVVASPDTVTLVLDPLGVYGTPERSTIIAHSSAATTVTVVRGSDGPLTGLSTRTHNQASVQETWQVSVTDQDFVHATLTGLSANDHPEYLLVSGSEPMTGLLTAPDGIAVSGGSLTVAGAAVVGSNVTTASTFAGVDCIGATALFTMTVAVISGGVYMVALSGIGTQVTVSATIAYLTVQADDGRLLIGSVPPRAFTGPLAVPALPTLTTVGGVADVQVSGSSTTGEEVCGSVMCPYVPAATRTTTFSVSGFSNAGALRLTANSAVLSVWRVG